MPVLDHCLSFTFRKNPEDRYSYEEADIDIMLTCPCDVDPLKTPLLYFKIGVYKDIHFFLFLL